MNAPNEIFSFVFILFCVPKQNKPNKYNVNIKDLLAFFAFSYYPVRFTLHQNMKGLNLISFQKNIYFANCHQVKMFQSDIR